MTKLGSHVVRGGAWLSLPSYLHSGDRLWSDPANRLNNLGFRLVQKEKTMSTIEKLDNHTQHLLGRGVCPKCGSPEIEGDPVDFFSGSEVQQECWCLECEQAWVDTYKLTSYEWVE